MSGDRAEFASSKFVNAIGDKKDVQFAGKDLRSFRTSPDNLHGASDDESDSTPSNTSSAHGTRHFFTTTSLGDSWKRQIISNEKLIPPGQTKYIAIENNNRRNRKQQRGFLYMVYDARPTPTETTWSRKTSSAPPQSATRWKLFMFHKHTDSDLIGFFIDNLGQFDQSKPYDLGYELLQHLQSAEKYLYFVPVSLYSSEIGSLKFMKRLAFVDKSGFLSADIHGPTIIDYKLDSDKHEPQSIITTPTTKSKRNRSRGKRKRISNVHKLDHPTVIIYINSATPCPYQCSIDSKCNSIVYPSLHISKKHQLHNNVWVAERVYYVVLKKTISNIPQFTNCTEMNRTKYEKMLRKHCSYFFTLLQVDTSIGIRFVSVPSKEFQSIPLPCCQLFSSHCFKSQVSDQANVCLPGETISMWSRRGYSYSQYQFTLRDCQSYQDVYGVGFGSRPRTYSIGCNNYFGPRRSNVSSVEPFQTKEGVYNSHYYRDTYNRMELAPLLESKVDLVGRNVLAFAREMDPNFNEVTGLYTCDRAIYTQGTSFRNMKEFKLNDVVCTTKTVGTIPSLGFANSPHIDTCDKIKPNQASLILNELNAKAYIKQHPINSYCKNIHSTTGLALPTTCGYQLCGNVPHGFKPVPTFAVCGFATIITHDIVHHFHGSAFPHFTPVPILVSKNSVRVNNINCQNPFFVVAWGRSGGSRQARDNRADNLLLT